MAEVTLPQLGETVTEGTITQWFKAVGENVTADEPLFEVSTDKVDTEVPSPVAGTLTEIRVPEGETVDVGTVIAVVSEGGEAPAAAAPAQPEEAAPAQPETAPAEPAAEAPAPEPEPEPAPAAAEPEPEPSAATQPAPAAPAPESAPAAPAPAPAAPADGAAAGRLLSPVVRRLVTEHGLDPAAITGTGPGGRITRDDVLDYIDAKAAAPAAAPQPQPAAAAAPAAAPAQPAAPAPTAAPAAPRRPPHPPRPRRAGARGDQP